ncbi:MAG: acyl-CoA synthetase [Sandaracinaceae bacterium]|nr:acyl-CoA synthetase [Sandaracinaceae bacterium]
MSALDLLARHDAASPVAIGRDRVIAAAELCAHVAAVADAMPEAREGDEVVVMCRDRHRFAVALIAAWRRGFAVALPPSAQPDAIDAVRRRGARTVIHDVDGVDRGIDVRSAPIVEAARARVGKEAFASIGPFDRDRVLAIVHTSGTTGTSLACAKTAGQLLGEAQVLVQSFEIARGVRVAAMVPPHHIYGLLFGVLVPLVAGGAYHRTTPLHPAEVAEVVRDGDVIVSVPAHLRALIASDAMPKPSRIFSSGAPLPPNVAEQLRLRFGWIVTEVFGSTETGGIAWRQSGGRGAWAPLPGVVVRAEDERLVLDSPFLSPSEPRPYRGADRVQLLEDGTFLHLGRADGVLKVGGVRVSIAEIEARLMAIEGVRDAAAIGVEVEGPRGVEVWAAVESDLSVSEIRRELVRWLAPVAVPRRIKVAGALPREPNGKVTRAALEALFTRRDR